jgi:hypothetical protein
MADDPSGRPTSQDLVTALEVLATFGSDQGLTMRISGLESGLTGATANRVRRVLVEGGIEDSVLAAAMAVKAAAGQINVVIHAVGILTALPHVLEPEEVIESLSLGAGSTGRAHDLETDRRIAEFKFIDWRGGPESIRQNSLFIDVFNLATADTEKRREMYVVGKDTPMRFLTNHRAIRSVLSKNRAVADRFATLHGERFRVVSEYYASIRDRVTIIDLRDVVPNWPA